MIAIVGLGVIGASFAMALARVGETDVYGIDTSEETIEKAKARSLIRDGDTDGSAILARADLVIIAIYPQRVPEFLAAHRNDFKPGAIITDATGVKSQLAKQIDRLIRADVDFVLGHPMAGREKMGIDYASDKVFLGANYILTPTARNKPENLDRIEALAMRIGFRGVRRISPETHDLLIAYTSQLPHAMAVALVNSDDESRDTGHFIGDSYRDLTRIAKINASLWSELFLENSRYLLDSIAAFENELDKIKAAIAAGDRAQLEALFRESTRRREEMDT